MVNPGDKFEKLVENVERTFERENATITWHDAIWDKVAEKDRVVDLSIRCKSGPYDILIVVQCRDRERNEGPDWIEEIVTQTRDIGAHVVVAVSSKGFTASAQKKAKHYGIVLKTLKEATPNEVASWKEAAQLRIDVTLWKPKRISPAFVTEDGTPLAYDQDVLNSLSKQQETSIGRESASGQPIRIGELVKAWLSGDGKEFHAGLPRSGKWVPATLKAEFRHKVVGPSAKGQLPLRGLVLEMDVCRSDMLLPPQVVRYHTEGSGESSMHQHWQAHMAEMFPEGGGNVAFVSLESQGKRTAG